jgi:protein SFI1
MLAKREFYLQVSTLANNRLVKAHLRIWYVRLKERQQDAWRRSMRQKIDITRDRRADKLRMDAWTKWRQSYRSHLFQQHCVERLVLRCYWLWKEKLNRHGQMVQVADQTMMRKDIILQEKAWSYWCNSTQLQRIEKIVQYKVGLRVLYEVVAQWRRQTQVNTCLSHCLSGVTFHRKDRGTANAYHNAILLRSTIQSWKTARGGVKVNLARPLWSN